SAVSIISFLIFKPYAGIIRHTSLEDIIRLAKSIAFNGVAILLLNISIPFWGKGWFPHMPYSIMIIYILSGLFLLLFTRMIIKILFSTFTSTGVLRRNVLIFGAGKAGLTTLQVINADKDSGMKAVGFLDHNPLLQSKAISGVPVYSPDAVNEAFIEKLKVKDIIFSVQNISPEEKRELIEALIAQASVVVKEIPPASSWINGELSLKQLNKVKIEDLLQRAPIKLSMDHVVKELRDKIILVTGAAGSIGSEISRQLCQVHPARLIFFDQAESPLYELQQELIKAYPGMAPKFEFIVGDVSNKETIERLFRIHRPQMVYHAAAYKHVPLMESNPFEAVRVNVFGTRIVADTATRYKVQKFVMISTDKAVNPTNVMGASKRTAEIYIQSLNLRMGNKTAFITTRFGNVLGSNGSVIPLFEKQIAAGGPVTVTHPDIIRYFMTIPEACQLVLEAGVMGMGGEIFLFDMGKPVKINDLALQMIRLSGLKPGKDIEIKYTGLRPGEKLFEELLNDGENNLPTHHPKITIAQVFHHSPAEVDAMFLDLQDSFNTYDRLEVVAQIKRIVPEFKSNNSEYQSLDRLN
ncbi:MAG: polysaccharide biosynthesis protein, partial [Lentimicrobium sp.]|nr:polysaccharide biosynthesis protein [Lentimicrobium sp.]